jgi:hypothetical protein
MRLTELSVTFRRRLPSILDRKWLQLFNLLMTRRRLVMTDKTTLISREQETGEIAVDGLIAGFIAGLAMAAYLVLSGLLSGIPLTETMGYFDPGPNARWLVGTLAHLAVSGIYGAVYALLFMAAARKRPSLLRFRLLLGLVYGLVLFAIARGVVLPAAESPLMQITTIHLLLAHAVYGLALGFILDRR